MDDKGKKFENQVKSCFLNLGDVSIDRLKDSMNGFKSIKNVCDFIAYKTPYIYYIECKSCHGNTFNFAKLTQYDELTKKIGITGVNAGALVWFIDHDKVVWSHIEDIQKQKELGTKSINIKDIGNDWIHEITTEFPRTYPKIDFSSLVRLAEEKAYNIQRRQI